MKHNRQSKIKNQKSKIRTVHRTKDGVSKVLKRAKHYLVGGVNSPVRAFKHVGSEPLIIVRANGSIMESHNGKRFVDFIMGWGALILGHRHKSVAAALKGALAKCDLAGLTCPLEIELARLIVEAIPSVEQVRFSVSGTEACMSALRLARAYTGRSKVLTFDGCYHGHSDSLIAHSSSGVPAFISNETLSVPYNDVPALEAAFNKYPDDFACVIVEPVCANMGVVLPMQGFLKRIRDLTTQYGSLLIFDEVVTGFRLCYGGVQTRFNIQPDITTFGKIIGGGLPIGAFGAARRIMQRLAPEGDVYHGGTFASHPLSMAGGIATLKELKSGDHYQKLEALSSRISDGLSRIAKGASVPLEINRIGSMMTCFFSDKPVVNAFSVKAARKERFARFVNTLRSESILMPPSPFEAFFVSSAHTESDVEKLLRASSKAMRSLSNDD